MEYKDPPFTVGIEEEYLLVDPETRDLASDPPEAILPSAMGHSVARWEGDTLVIESVGFDERTYILPNGWFGGVPWECTL